MCFITDEKRRGLFIRRSRIAVRGTHSKSLISLMGTVRISIELRGHMLVITCNILPQSAPFVKVRFGVLFKYSVSPMAYKRSVFY